MKLSFWVVANDYRSDYKASLMAKLFKYYNGYEGKFVVKIDLVAEKDFKEMCGYRTKSIKAL